MSGGPLTTGHGEHLRRPDLLFDRDIMDEAKLGDSATQFFLWLNYGPEIVPPHPRVAGGTPPLVERSPGGRTP